MRGWTKVAMRLRYSGRLMALRTKLRTLIWAIPWTDVIEVRPRSSTVGHSCLKLSSENSTNLLTVGVYTMIDGTPKRCVLNMPTPSPYLFQRYIWLVTNLNLNKIHFDTHR